MGSLRFGSGLIESTDTDKGYQDEACGGVLGTLNPFLVMSSYRCI